MAQIKLTPEDLRQSAQRYAQGSQDIDQILTTLTHEQQVIDANWDGSAFDSFEAQFNELSPKIKQFAQLLEDINGQLIKVADIVEGVRFLIPNPYFVSMIRKRKRYGSKT